jgi:tetratricopeptide (TPR) repeat protein
MTKTRIVPAILFAAALCCSFASQAQTPQQVLQQYVSDLQRSPDDTALREKIIRHVRSMKRAPAIPEEARRHFIEGNALLKAAKDEKGYELAIDAYRQCLLIAPWWGEANYNFAIALELANRFDSSVNALKLYIATNPGKDESRKAQDRIYEIGAKKIIAAREREDSTAKAAAEAKARLEAEERAKLDSVEGAWMSELGGKPNPDFIMRIYRNSDGHWSIAFPDSSKLYAYDIKQTGRSISFTRMIRGADPELNTDYYNLTLSADGTKLTGTLRSISISGNNPHWVTDEATWYRR